MKRDESYNPSIKSSHAPDGLMFRMASAQDLEPVTELMAERNPTMDVSALLRKTEREITLNSTDPRYRLFVAELNGKVVGLCRYFHSEGLPKEKLTFPAPHGWYCMGILVAKEFRRQGIARFLFHNRLKSLKGQGASVIYSIVDAANLASVRMHQEFGFEEVERASGFLHIKFEGGSGILYQMHV